MEFDDQDPASSPLDIDTLVETYQGPLLRYAMRLVRDEDRAQDIVQEVFLRYVQSPPRATESRQISNWLFRVAHNRSVDFIRKEIRMREQVQSMPDPGHSPPPSEDAIRAETRRQLDSLMDRLSDNQRTCLVLKFQEDKSYKEISEITGLSVSNVGFLLHQAVKKMGRFLVQEEAI
jgi:RNA polymerase sigma-70 factor (ECF subfamily)